MTRNRLSAIPLLTLDHGAEHKIEQSGVEQKEKQQVAFVHLLVLHQSGNGVDRLEHTEEDDRFTGIFHEEVSGDMVHVTAVGRECRAPFELAAYHDDERVEDGECRDEEHTDRRQVRQ